MKKTIVLLAGYPATGKSYLCNKILEKLPDFLIVSQDDMKEKNYLTSMDLIIWKKK